MLNKLRTATFKYQSLLFEVMALLTISGGFLILLWHVQRTVWKDFLFMNADMLTLSLLWESIRIGEPFHWVFSSQIFIFPEFILYAISALLSPDLHSTILVNAFINILLLYACIRFILYALGVKTAIARLTAVGYVTIVFMCLLLEQRLYPLTMYYLVTTAYYGVIVVGLFAIGLSILLIRRLSEKKRKASYYLAASIGLLSLLTSTANPMFLLQIAAPICVIAFLFCIARLINWRTFLWLVLPHVAAGLLSVLLRKTVLNDLFSPMGEISNYLHLENFIEATRQYKAIFIQLLTGPWEGRVELLIVLIAMLGSTALLLLITFHSRLPKRFQLAFNPEQRFLITFASLAPLATLFGTILTGNAVTRYLLPLAFFPLLGYMPLVILIKKYSMKRIHLSLAVSFGLVVILALVTQAWHAPQALATYYPKDVACLDGALKGSDNRNGVAQFWRARGMQLNSHSGHTVLQVTGDLKPFEWLYNQSSYQLYEVSFVIVDTFVSLESSGYEVSGADNFTIDPGATVALLGQPSHIYHCKSFDIYLYDKHNSGRQVLNQRLRQQY